MRERWDERFSHFMSKTVLFRVNACCNLAHNAFRQSGSDSCICDVALHEIKHMFPFKPVLIGIDDLPATSSEIKQVTSNKEPSWCSSHAIYLWEPTNARPLKQGWEKHFGAFSSSKCPNHMPWSLLKIFKCVQMCYTGSCGCRSAEVLCIIFSHRKTENLSCTDNFLAHIKLIYRTFWRQS